MALGRVDQALAARLLGLMLEHAKFTFLVMMKDVPMAKLDEMLSRP
jgi:hypothetical protein